MCKKLKWVVFVVFSICISKSEAQQSIGYWKFDEGSGDKTYDFFGKHEGIMHGTKWTKGRLGNCLSFETTNYTGNYVEIEDCPELSIADSMTIALWVKVYHYSVPLLNKLEYWDPGNYDLKIERNGRLRLSYETRINGGKAFANYDSDGILTIGKWHHIAVTIVSQGQVNFYIDFKPAGTVKQVRTFGIKNNHPLRIGAKPDPYSWFEGKIDELRIYHSVLTLYELKKLTVTSPPKDANEQIAIKNEQTKINTTSIKNNPATKSEKIDTAAYWPQWRGQLRDGKSTETGLLKQWPSTGPDLLWHIECLGEGYSSVSIANGLIYTTGRENAGEYIYCFNLAGDLIWKKSYGPSWDGAYPEVRSTPTINEGKVYVTSGLGRVVCFDAKTGERIWIIDAVKKFEGEYDFWGIAESPLIDNEKIFCTIGGGKNCMVALNKYTGETIWTAKGINDPASYCSPILIKRGNCKILLTMMKFSMIGINVETGSVMWRIPYSDYIKNPHGINPNTPIYDHDSFYTTNGYGNGGSMHFISESGTEVQRKWYSDALDCHHGQVILVDGYIYGTSMNGHRNGCWVCLDWNTGKTMYKTEWFSKGSLIYADGMLYCYEEKEGNIALVKASPEDFNIISSFHIDKGKGMNWAIPVICGGRLYIRHGNVLMAYNIKNNK